MAAIVDAMPDSWHTELEWDVRQEWERDVREGVLLRVLEDCLVKRRFHVEDFEGSVVWEFGADLRS